MNFRNQNGERENHTVKQKGDPVSNDLPDKEEAVYDINLLPELHFLQSCKGKS